MLKKWPDLAPARPEGTIPLTLSDAELLTMAVMSALLGFTSERRWLRYADKGLAGTFPREVRPLRGDKRGGEALFPFIPVVRKLGRDASPWGDGLCVVGCT